VALKKQALSFCPQPLHHAKLKAEWSINPYYVISENRRTNWNEITLVSISLSQQRLTRVTARLGFAVLPDQLSWLPCPEGMCECVCGENQLKRHKYRNAKRFLFIYLFEFKNYFAITMEGLSMKRDQCQGRGTFWGEEAPGFSCVWVCVKWHYK